jgi:hypothetical protein
VQAMLRITSRVFETAIFLVFMGYGQKLLLCGSRISLQRGVFELTGRRRQGMSGIVASLQRTASLGASS